MDENGNAEFNINTIYNNNFYGKIYTLINYSAKEQKEKLLNYLSDIKNVEIYNFSVSDESEDYAKGSLTISGKINNFSTVSGTRMFIDPEFIHPNDYFNFVSEKRKLPIYEPENYTYIDSVTISLPKSYSSEHLQNNKELNSIYGIYSFNIKDNDNSILITRKVSINKDNYDKNLFEEINNFLEDIYNYEHKKIILTTAK